MDRIGKAANNPHVKQLLNTKNPDIKLTEHLQESGKEQLKKTCIRSIDYHDMFNSLSHVVLIFFLKNP